MFVNHTEHFKAFSSLWRPNEFSHYPASNILLDVDTGAIFLIDFINESMILYFGYDDELL
jgi:hypothetical protein